VDLFQKCICGAVTGSSLLQRREALNTSKCRSQVEDGTGRRMWLTLLSLSESAPRSKWRC
jgi:hypothetical protein